MNKISQNFTKLFFFLATIWNAPWRLELLERSLALLERRIAVARVRVCDGNAMRVR